MAKSLKSFLAKKYPEAISVNMVTDVTYIDTRIPTLNYVISGKPKSGGIPLNGKIVCLYGPEASGKTSLILQFIREAQKKNIEVVFLDTERSITQNRARQFGIDFDKMIYASPDTMEECFMMIEDIYKEKADTATLDEPIVIIWDSLAATPTNAETNRTADQVEIASQAGVLTRNLRRIRGKIKKMNAGVILIQQARANQDRYGDLFSMPGGYALHHTVDLILRVNKMKANESEMGVKISTPQKNRLFKPFQNTVIQFDYTNGFTKENIIVAFCEFLRNIEILGSAGAWCYLQTDVDDIIKKDPSLTEKEAKAQVKKFYLKDFASRLVEDENYFNEMLEVAEDYVNKNISKVAKIMVDDEVPIDVLESNLDGIEVEGEAVLSKT